MNSRNLSSRSRGRSLFVILVLCWLTFGISNSTLANDAKPAVEITSLLRANMYPTGYFNILDLDLMFTPEGSDIEVTLMSASGESVLVFTPQSSRLIAENNAFSRIRMKGTNRAKLAVGDYVIETKINDVIATRLKFSAYQEKSNDPFATNQKIHYNGDWQKLAYLRFVQTRNFTNNVDYQGVNFRMWSGLSDLPEGKRRDQLIATLTRDKKIIGHSKKTSGSLTSNGEINNVNLVIFEPHDRDKEANVLPLSESDLVSGNHSYQLTVTRQSDGHVLRDFRFQSKDSALVPLSRSEIGHTPQHEYLAPRALLQGTQNYDFETVYWMAM